VTIPFRFEGEQKILQALNGVEEIRRNVDALLVINNERLRDIYANLSMINAFAKADDTLAIAAKSIAEIITLPGLINLDFADVNTTMKDGGVALISNGYGEGERRVQAAIDGALNSPLLNNNDIFTARKILFNISFSETDELLMEEMDDVHNFMTRFNNEIEVIWGTTIDNELGNKVKMTILATGFGLEAIPEMEEMESQHRREIDERIREYYSPQGKDESFTHRFAILSTEEAADEEFITLLEDNPTYNRDPRLISNYRAKNKGGRPSENLPPPPPASGGGSGKVILFQ
jgi:cell division protein FtsZ